jgi:hypothetical protein
VGERRDRGKYWSRRKRRRRRRGRRKRSMRRRYRRRGRDGLGVDFTYLGEIRQILRMCHGFVSLLPITSSYGGEV